MIMKLQGEIVPHRMNAARPAFDLQRIADQWGTPPDEIFGVVLKLFYLEGAKLCADAQASFTDNRREDLHRAVHTLCSAAGNVCAMSLSGTARELMQLALKAPESQLARLMARLNSDWTIFDEAMQAGGPLGG